jgi:hypothetical protein
MRQRKELLMVRCAAVFLLFWVGCSAPPGASSQGGDAAPVGAPDAGVDDASVAPPDSGIWPRPDAGDTPLRTWHKDARAVVERSCSGCHSPGQIAPFSLTDFDSVVPLAVAVRAAVASGSMPPGEPGPDCNGYDRPNALTEAARAALLGWIDDGLRLGDEADYRAPPAPSGGMSRTDLILEMPVDYLPRTSPDDYRCFLIDWPEDRQRFITGINVIPGNPAVVHHVIAFLVHPPLVERFRGKDEREEGVGYTCFGGPGEIMNGVDWLGSWAPGGVGYDLPAGTGIAVPAGSLVVLQVHYNTLTVAPQADKSAIAFRLDDTVERASLWLPWTNPFWVSNEIPMLIPAGATGVHHSFSFDPTVDFVARPFGAGVPFEIHMVGLHMHLLGKTVRLSIDRAGGTTTCLEQIPDWDFDWQGGARLSEPVRFDPGDSIRIDCTWDNTPSRQPVIDGVRQQPRDVHWGEGTTDEMCLGLMYVAPLRQP